MAIRVKVTKSPATSEGARYEREAFRKYLRRRHPKSTSTNEHKTINEILNWVLKRQERYEKKPGGL